MNRNKNINQEVEKTLQIFESNEPIKADAFFYTRLKARMDAESQKNVHLFGLDINNILRPVLLTCIVALNIITFILVLKTSEPTREAQLDSFAESYRLNSTESLLFE